ncbi:MAG: M48 family metalloprotease [Planctomycetes bacterium]|nr:M48 family metalloprotease [Planctomycetota bacterium]
MGLPVAFLVGLLATFAAREFDPPIAGSGEPDRLALAALALALPTLLALAARGLLRVRIRNGRHGGKVPPLALRLSMACSPLVVLLFTTYGGWADFAWRLAGASDLASLALLIAPVVVVEVPRIVLATQAAIWIDVGYDMVRSAGLSRPHLPRIATLGPILRLRLGWIVLVTLPWLLLGLALDVLAFSREIYAFMLGTSLGLTIGFVVLLLAAALVLPPLFRLAFGTRPDLPEPLGSELRLTAMTLGFDPRRVLLLPTGMSAVNAMMVGPLPISRCLCVTDGLLRMLDADALSGVVAHEVGHARMGHPGLLVLLAVVLPLLLLHPLSLLQLENAGVPVQLAVGTLAVLAIWLVVRALAHRFELEADIASVRALGAGPCSRALRAVVHGTLPIQRHLLGRLSSLHPDEAMRLSTMARYEREPDFRARFDGAGRRLRFAIFGAVVLALCAAAWIWVVDWPFERALWRFHAGDVAAATRLQRELGDEVPARWQETWVLFDAELAAANELVPTATDWPTARAGFERAFERGLEVWRAHGPAAARPWLALAAEVSGPQPLLRQQLFELARAAADGEPELVAAIREVVRRREVPPAVAELLATEPK